MKIILPRNIFSSFFMASLENNHSFDVEYKDSSIIARSLELNTSTVALMPSLDLIKHNNLFVSKKFGLSYLGNLSNSYIYFAGGKKTVDKIFLRGDVSINEIILTKILFSEQYSTDVEITLDSGKDLDKSKNIILTGDENLLHSHYEYGVSFADEAADLLEFPYINFVFASPDRESMKLFNESVFSDNTEDKVDLIAAQMGLQEETKLFLKENIGSVGYSIGDIDTVALSELIKLVYYHGIADDIFDVKFL